MTEFDCAEELKEENKKVGLSSKPMRIDPEDWERSQLSLNSVNAITGLQAAQEKHEQNEINLHGARRSPLDTTDNTRYTLGLDFVVTALLAVAGINKVRQERKIPAQNGESPSQNILNVNNSRMSLNSSSGYWPNHENKRSTFIIGSDDCLCRVASSFFQNADLGWLIADINSHRIDQRWEEKTRVVSVSAQQVLDLPLSNEIEQFLKNKTKDMCSKNLITVVLQNSCSKEKLEEKLAPVVPKLIQD